LRFGADDMGSIMIEENVVSAAGADTRANEKELRYQIREAGFRPQQRDILYNYVNREKVETLDERKSLPLGKLSVAFAD
jgi:cyclic dehypoxanthinyl futalosine synthase